MAFKLNTIKNTVSNRNVIKPAALVTVRGSLYTNNLTTGLLEAATTTTLPTQILYVSNENIAAAQNLTSVNCSIISTDDEFLVDTSANTAAANNGQRMVITAGGATVTNSGTDAPTAPFIQITPVGVAADRKIIAIKQ